MKLKSWFESMSFSKKLSTRRTMMPEGEAFTYGQKGGRDKKSENTFVTFPRFHKAYPLVEPISHTQNEKKVWDNKRNKAHGKIRKQVHTTNFEIKKPAMPIPTSNGDNYNNLVLNSTNVNYYQTVGDGVGDRVKPHKVYSYIEHGNSFNSNGSVIENMGAYSPEKWISKRSTSDKVRDHNNTLIPAFQFSEHNVQFIDALNDCTSFMLPNFSYDSRAICLKSTKTGEELTSDSLYNPRTSMRRRMMIKTNPWFDYSRIDTSGYSVSDESFYSNNIGQDLPNVRYEDENGFDSPKRVGKTNGNGEVGSLETTKRQKLWTSTLKNELVLPVASNGDSGYYDDIRDLRAPPDFHYPINSSYTIAERRSENRISSPFYHHGFKACEENNQYLESDCNLYSIIGDEDSGCSNTNSWSYRSSGPSSRFGENNSNSLEGSTLSSVNEALREDLSPNENSKMSPTSTNKRIVDNIIFWEHNHRDVLSKLKDYRKKINENKRYLSVKMYEGDCRSHFNQYSQTEGFNSSNVMIYEMDPIIYI